MKGGSVFSLISALITENVVSVLEHVKSFILCFWTKLQQVPKHTGNSGAKED
jgi:hypothetical protein